ncbi:MAG: DUF308 domain-containing protein [Bacteroidales bacterium]|nr:DUF308 domain-containing protein [Bacteroidales bacterium]
MTIIQESRNTFRSWWMYLLNGILLIVLGIWMLTMPRESFETLSLIIGLIVSITGVLETILAFYYRKVHKEWGWNISGGILDIIIGVFLIVNPNIIMVLITLFISFWLILGGILVTRKAIDLRKQGRKNWIWILLFGILILLLAVVLIWHPQIVGITMMFWLAISFVSLGVFRVVLAFNLKSLLRA